MHHISSNISSIINQIVSRNNPILAEIIIHWGKIIGDKFVNKSYPIKIISYKNNGKFYNTLYIKASNASISMDMMFHQEIIMEQLTIYLGHKAIHKLHFIT